MGVPVTVGILVGLAASFVQSLGLTLQRLSHLANEKVAPDQRTRDWKRPLWLVGLAIFLVSNVAGTLFQIGTLPLVVLGPLGAVSLVCNALFARLLLGDAFSIQLAVGSALIAAGATLVGIFGTVPEETHTLPELVALYRRPAFLAWLAFLSAALTAVVATAHLVEWRLARTLANLPPGTPKLPRRRAPRGRRPRRWSSPTAPAGPPLSSSTTSALRHGRTESTATERAPLLSSQHAERQSKYREASTRFAQRIDPVRPRALELPAPATAPTSGTAAAAAKSLPSQTPPVAEILQAADRTRLGLAIAYGATSGSLSGLCLLFTKTGMDLVIQTLVNRNNQFGHLEAWALLIVLLVCELAQLSYLNRALRLVGPTLVCPTAFCFYNATSILSGLIYYRQLDALKPLQGALVALGSAVLLGGVWIVSVKPAQAPDVQGEDGEAKMDVNGVVREEGDVGSGVSMDEMGDEDDESADSEDELIPYRPRGFSIGISAASPGFEIRPSTPRRDRHSHDLSGTGDPRSGNELGWSTSSLPAQPTSPSYGATGGPGSALSPGLSPDGRDSPKTPPGGVRRDRRLPRRSRGHRRDGSLTGAPYVGPVAPVPHSTAISFVEEPEEVAGPEGGPGLAAAPDDDGLGAAPEGSFATAKRTRPWWQVWGRGAS
ncbi:hypothetical protein JCM8202_004039 [Rhodotorula sphaerocarpa]